MDQINGSDSFAIGVLLASGLGGGRSRNSRFAEPIVTALSQVALQLFR